MSQRIQRGEILAGGAGAALLASLAMLPWLRATSEGEAGISRTGFEAFALLDLILAAAAGLAILVLGVALTGAAGRFRAGVSRVAAAIALAGLALIVVRIAFVPEFAAAGADDAHVTRAIGLAAGLAATALVAVGDVLNRSQQPVAPAPRAVPVVPGPVPPVAAEPPAAEPIAAAPSPAPKVAKREPKPKRARPKPAKPRAKRRPSSQPSPEVPITVAEPAPGIDRLATVTFEELRDIGLSITQAKRLLKYRDELGALRGAADLAKVPGLSRETVADLQRRLAGG